MLRGELERFRPLSRASAEGEVELCSLTFSHWADSTDVSIRPLTNTKKNPKQFMEHKHTSTVEKSFTRDKLLTH